MNEQYQIDRQVSELLNPLSADQRLAVTYHLAALALLALAYCQAHSSVPIQLTSEPYLQLLASLAVGQ